MKPINSIGYYIQYLIMFCMLDLQETTYNQVPFVLVVSQHIVYVIDFVIYVFLEVKNYAHVS